MDIFSTSGLFGYVNSMGGSVDTLECYDIKRRHDFLNVFDDTHIQWQGRIGARIHINVNDTPMLFFFLFKINFHDK